MGTDTFQIKTAGFEGPFALLLGLIEKQKFHINDVSLANVTEEYLNFLQEIQNKYAHSNQKQAHEISHFIIVASTLILIKSKSLLPSLTLTDEEEGDIRTLEERLRLYEMFTKLSLNIKNKFGKEIIFAPEERKTTVKIFLPDAKITQEQMLSCVKEVLGSMPKKIFMPEVEVKKVVSIEEMIDRLAERIQKSMSVNFRDFTGHKRERAATKEEKIEVIVGFLAMLEMVRQGVLDAVQAMDGDDIIISNQV